MTPLTSAEPLQFSLAEDIGLYVNTKQLIYFCIARVFHVELHCFKLKLLCYNGRAAESDESVPDHPRGIWSACQRKSFLIWVLIMAWSLRLCWEWNVLWHQHTLIMKCLNLLEHSSCAGGIGHRYHAVLRCSLSPPLWEHQVWESPSAPALQAASMLVENLSHAYFQECS